MSKLKVLVKDVLAGRHYATALKLRNKIRSPFYKGTSVECPCCRGRFRKFLSASSRFGTVHSYNQTCPRCGAEPRHRLLKIFLDRNPSLFSVGKKVLHFAPEMSIAATFEPLGRDYYTSDLESPLASLKCNITDLPLRDRYFDLILCNHVLEHIPDDRAAMREIFRVLNTGGTAILNSPVQRGLAKTFEDPAVVDPLQREKLFGQDDHVRVYGADYVDRLVQTGFTVQVVDFFSQLPEPDRILFAVEHEDIFLCGKSVADLQPQEWTV